MISGETDRDIQRQKHTEGKRETDRQTDRQTGRQADRKKERHRESVLMPSHTRHALR